MSLQTARRLNDIKEYYFAGKLREIEKMNRSGANVINLGIGSPDLMPPPEAIETLADSCRAPHHHGYQNYKGIPALRNGFAEWYIRYYGVTLDPEREILPLIGSKEGIMHISMTYVEEGDEVLVPDPGYPAYPAATKLAGGTVVTYNLEEKSGWLPDLDKLSKRNLSKVKLMWVNYPNMPTGTKASLHFFSELIAFGKEHNILICNDNPYSFILNDDPVSLLSVPGAMDTAIELNSLSKSHNMAGWRIGMMAGNDAIVRDVLRFKSNMDSGMFLPIQQAAAEALKSDHEWYKNQNNSYKSRRKLVWGIMDHLGCAYQKDQTGMFVWAKLPDEVKNAEEWVDHILQESKVFITPGFIFGENGKRFVRVSLCNKEEILVEVLQRLQSLANKKTVTTL